MDTKMNNFPIIEELGLTSAESKIYLAVLELGTSKAAPIIWKTGLQNSVVHLTVNKLVEKGLLSFIKKGNIKYYQATDPRVLLDELEEKKRELNKIMPLLIQMNNSDRQEATIYEGFNGFKRAMYDLIKDAKAGEEYLFFNYFSQDPAQYNIVYEFYKEFEKERIKRGLLVKGLAPKGQENFFQGRELKNIKFINLPMPANITIFQNTLIFEPPWSTKLSLIVIKSKAMAESFRLYWHALNDSN